jgi:hypothetical protein
MANRLEKTKVFDFVSPSAPNIPATPGTAYRAAYTSVQRFWDVIAYQTLAVSGSASVDAMEAYLNSLGPDAIQFIYEYTTAAPPPKETLSPDSVFWQDAATGISYVSTPTDTAVAHAHVNPVSPVPPPRHWLGSWDWR